MAAGLHRFSTHAEIGPHRRFRVRWRLRLESHFLQPPFDPHQPLVTFNGEAEGLTIQVVILSVQESDDRTCLPEVAPRTLKNIALSSRLFRRDSWGIAVPAKGFGTASTLISGRMVNRGCRFQVTDPGRARPAPSASRIARI